MSVAIAGIGLTAALGAMRSLASAESRATRTELMQRLAFQKYDEVVATGEIEQAPLTGDFRERGIEGYEWRAELDQSGIENLGTVTVTVTPVRRGDNLETRITGLRFVPVPPTEEAAL